MSIIQKLENNVRSILQIFLHVTKITMFWEIKVILFVGFYLQKKNRVVKFPTLNLKLINVIIETSTIHLFN